MEFGSHDAQFLRGLTVTVTPVYRTRLDEREELAVRHSSLSNPGAHVFLAPENLSADYYESAFPEITLMRVPDSHLASVGSYSSWLMTADFYDRFTEFEWILICQTDAVLLENPWLRLAGVSDSWDYLGAPWSPPIRVLSVGGRLSVYSETGAVSGPRLTHRFGRKVHVGNGGLSLRRRQVFSAASTSIQEQLHPSVVRGINEDVIWCSVGTKFGVRVAPVKLAEKVFFESAAGIFDKSARLPEVSGYHGINKWPRQVLEQVIGGQV